MLPYQQERTGSSLANPPLAVVCFEARSMGLVFDGHHHLCAVFNEQGLCHSLPLLVMTAYILILAAPKGVHLKKKIVCRICSIWTLKPLRSRSKLSKMILESTAFKWIMSLGINPYVDLCATEVNTLLLFCMLLSNV